MTSDIMAGGRVADPTRPQPTSRTNRGWSLYALGRYDEALAEAAVCGGAPGKALTAYIHLLRGEFERGLKLHRTREAVERLHAPLHKLADLAGKSVLIVHEQSHGDSIQMARFVPQIAAVAKSVRWLTLPALVRLLSQLPATVTAGDLAHVSAPIALHDAFVLVFDLWQTCGLVIDGKPYLKAEPRRVERMRDLLPAGRLIGLAWRGSADHPNDRNRSTALAQFMPDIPGATFISLQKDLTDQERRTGLFDGGSRIDDFADCAALIACLDVLVSVDSAPAHLGGALGISTCILLPYAPDWRWGEAGDTTPWYDSVRLFRQPSYGAWAPPIAAVSAFLTP